MQAGTMKLTPHHLEYYRQQKAPVPGWASELSGSSNRNVSVHALINIQAGVAREKTRDPSYVIHNTMNILRSVQRREGSEGLRKSLMGMAAAPGCFGRPERRAASCRKWLARLGGSTEGFEGLANRLLSQESGEWVAQVFQVHSRSHCSYKDGKWRLDDQLLGLHEIRQPFIKLLSSLDRKRLQFAINRANRSQ